MPRTSRKNQIKNAIMRKPKYGGPQGGRPQAPKRVGKARAASSGINYLGKGRVWEDGSRGYRKPPPFRSLGSQREKGPRNV